ncbi:MAG: hypothetical protein ACHQYQ_02415 [Bacteriovoracales bacterium]|jgi:hypothetical protein
MTLDEAINLLKKTVKYSAVKNQKHIDLTLISAEELPIYEKALAIVTNEVQKGTITDKDLKQRIGIP